MSLFMNRTIKGVLVAVILLGFLVMYKAHSSADVRGNSAAVSHGQNAQVANSNQQDPSAASTGKPDSPGSNGLAVAEENIPACPGAVAEGNARCHARVIASAGAPKITPTPAGFGPAQFRGAYGVSGHATVNTTIAIVDAYDNPNALSDLTAYSTMFGIRTLGNCAVSSGTTSNPCFQKVSQSGSSTYPKADSGWALESSLDVQAIHAMCDNCNILLVEANSASYNDLMTAIDRARTMGAKVISNSYGSAEFSGETAYDSHFNYPGIAFLFSSGDSGYGASYPAGSRYVTSVGGTTLNMSGNTYVSETTWSGAGSGCSAYETKPSFQHDNACARRTIADVSADANPSTGAAVYDSLGMQGQKGWFKVGGTSLAAPLVAAVYGLGAIGSSVFANTLPYATLSGLRDITSGSNGSCGGSYLCTAISGYDGPTGLGTPNGISAF